MKNILSSLTESEKSRILGMHKSATARQYLMEQSGTTQTPIGGGAAPGVMSVPGYENFIKFNQNSGNYSFLPGTIKSTLVNYLGGEGSYLSGVIGKTILITQKTLYTYEKMGNFSLQNNSLDGVIIGSFVPKSWYVGGNWQDPTNANSQYLYLFNKEVTTNYSGDINKPFLENGQAIQLATIEKPTNANLYIETQPKIGSSGVDYYYPRVEASEDIPKTLKVTRVGTPGKDFIRIRTTDGYCPELKGYADYLLYVGIPGLGKMFGVNKI